MFYKIRGLAATVCLFLFVVGAVFAQTPRELRFGTWVPGTLREGEEQWFSVRPSQAGLVVVETSGDTDTYLEVFDSNRAFISANDDGGEEYNAKLEILAEAGKTYLFKLKCFDEDESGPYQIRASFSSVSARELSFGTWVPGTLRKGEEQWFSFRPSQAGLVIVETSGDLDTYLTAFNASGPVIDEDDDGGKNYNARLEIFADAGNTYFFKLRELDDSGGSFQILASFESFPPDTERNTERLRAAAIKLGESVPVFLRSPSESRWFRFDITRANTLFVVQTRGNRDTVLALYDSRGNLIEDDDDSGDGENAMISIRLDPGTVYIEVKEYEGRIGRFTIHAETR